MDSGWTDFLDALRGLLSIEILTTQNRSITVGKVVGGLVVFAAGWLAARVASGAVGRRVLPRLRLEEGVGAAYQSLLYYALVVVAFLLALQTVDIPLTVFAVAGGALAIGLGFGSQNVMNNFISGLILLAERPIKVGDLIDVGDVYGTVESIGLRSTRLRTGSNVHVIVPNASFLEGRVVNWTHDTPQVRVQIRLGVVYGSPTGEVKRILGDVIAAHPSVLPSPAPIVLFVDFGNDSLVFEAHFWIRMRNLMDRSRVESDIRFAIDDAFREAGITIAFPQRDVHLDAARPLEVVLARGTDAEGERR
jgi:potassium efflux system protein